MTTDVIVVGAGPSGLATACELAWRGVSVTVLDAADEPFRGSRGKGLQPRTLELLDRLGLADRLVSRGRYMLPLRRWSTDENGEPVGTDVDMHPQARPGPDSPYGRGLMIPQWRTEQVLREHLAELGVAVRWGTRVAGLEQDDDGVTLTVSDGAPLRARWVVGCDGGSSAVRHALGVPFLGETHEDMRMLVGDLVVDGLDRDRWHMWEPFVGLCPLPTTDTFCFQGGGEDSTETPTVATFQDVLDRVGAGHVRVREVVWSSRWRLNVRMVDRYRVGRVFLAGDAAHVHSPAGGQGMNTGIGDGVNLGWKLAAVHAGADETLLDTYEAERLPVAAGVLGLSSLLTRRRMGERGAEGDRTLQLGVGYRGGPLTAGPDGSRPRPEETAGQDDRGDAAQTTPPGTTAPGHTASGDTASGDTASGDTASGDTAPGDTTQEDVTGPHPGDRAPDAPLRDADDRRVRLFEMFRHPGWTLVGFGTVPPSVPGVRSVTVVPAGEPLSADPTGVELRDRAGFAAAAYAPHPGELVLVRPDGYVGLRTGNPDAVHRYLADLLPANSAATV